MKMIRCSDCGAKVIPWASFPDTLQAIVSCSGGVSDYMTKEEYQEALISTPIFGVDYTDESHDEEIGDGDHSGEE